MRWAENAARTGNTKVRYYSKN